MFWFSAPTRIDCVASAAARKFTDEPTEDVTVHSPVELNVTTPPANEQVPPAVKVGVTPDARPVTVEMAAAVGV